MAEDALNIVRDFMAPVVGAMKLEDTLNVLKDFMGLVASAIFLYVPFKLWGLYKARAKLNSVNVRSSSLSEAIKAWKEGTDSIIQDATVRDFGLLLLALVLSVMSTFLGFLLSVFKLCFP